MFMSLHNKKMLALLLMVVSLSFPTGKRVAQESAVSMSGRHIMIFEAGYGSLTMNYFFGVENSSEASQRQKIPIVYPMRMVHLQPVAQLSTEELVFDEQLGRMVVHKEFEPGVSVLAVRFQVPAGSRRQTVHLDVPDSLPSLALLSGGGIHIEAKGFKDGVPEDLAGSRLRGQISQQPVESGLFEVHLERLPEDRRWFYYLAAGVAAALMLMSVARVLREKSLRKVAINA